MILLDLNWNELKATPRCGNCVGQLKLSQTDQQQVCSPDTNCWLSLGWKPTTSKTTQHFLFLVRGRLPPVGWGHPAGSNWASLIMKADEPSWQAVIDDICAVGGWRDVTVSSEAAFLCYLPLWFSLFLWEWITIALFSASHLLPSFSCLLPLLSPNCLLC